MTKPQVSTGLAIAALLWPEFTVVNGCVFLKKVARAEVDTRFRSRTEFDENHVHFLIQSVPSLSPTYVVNMIKGITAREIFKLHPRIKKEVLWGGHFWTSGFYINTVGKFANEEMMKNYIKHQGIPKQYQKDYKKIYYNNNQLNLFTID